MARGSSQVSVPSLTNAEDDDSMSSPVFQSPKEVRFCSEADLAEQKNEDGETCSLVTENGGLPEDQVFQPKPKQSTSPIPWKKSSSSQLDAHLNLTESSASPEAQSFKETPGSFQENQLDHLQYSTAVNPSPKEIHSFPEPQKPDVREHPDKAEDQPSRPRRDGNAKACGEVQVPRPEDEDDSSDIQTSKETLAPFQENRSEDVQSSRSAGDHLNHVPRSHSSRNPEEAHTGATLSQVSPPPVLSSDPREGESLEPPLEVEDPSTEVSPPVVSAHHSSPGWCPESDSEAALINLLDSNILTFEGTDFDGPKCPMEGTGTSVGGPPIDRAQMAPAAPEEDSKTFDDVSSEADQLDVHALMPSYEIHFTAGEDGETASDPLRQDADPSAYRAWAVSGVEDGPRAWLPTPDETAVVALRPDAVLLGAFPYSTVLPPPGPCEWAWHAGPPQVTLNPDAEVWTGCGYDYPQHTWLHIPNELQHEPTEIPSLFFPRPSPECGGSPPDPGLPVGPDLATEGEAQHLAAGDSAPSEPDAGVAVEQLRSVLEICLSREHLAKDSYLQSQMDDEQYVPIATLADLHAVKVLGADSQLVADVVQTLPWVQMSPCQQKVRPNHSQYLLILREIPSSTPRQEVEALLSVEKLPDFLSCEFVSSDNWFVTFASEADAYQAYKYLREEVRVFQGKPIMVRMKAKSTTFTSHVTPNGFGPPNVLADYQTSFLPPDAYPPLYEFAYPAWSGSGYSDRGESLEPDGVTTAAYFRPPIPRRRWRTSRPPGGADQFRSHKNSAEDVLEAVGANWRPGRAWSGSRGVGANHRRGGKSAPAPHSPGGRFVNGGPRRRENPYPAANAGEGLNKRPPPRPPTPIELGVSNFPPLDAKKTSPPAESSPDAAEDHDGEASQKLSYAAICQKTPVKEK
ncbi:uncharacterized protein LOC144091553 isoform X2 [Stigmatopora argus]